MSLFEGSEAAILNSFFGSGAPTVWELGVSTTVPNEDGTGITEPTDPSYARIAITNNGTNWSVATAGQTQNLVAFSFPQATEDQGTILYFVLWDQDSGDPFLYGSLLPTRTVNTGDILHVPINGLTITAN